MNTTELTKASFEGQRIERDRISKAVKALRDEHVQRCDVFPDPLTARDDMILFSLSKGAHEICQEILDLLDTES